MPQEVSGTLGNLWGRVFICVQTTKLHRLCYLASYVPNLCIKLTNLHTLLEIDTLEDPKMLVATIVTVKCTFEVKEELDKEKLIEQTPSLHVFALTVFC